VQLVVRRDKHNKKTKNTRALVPVKPEMQGFRPLSVNEALKEQRVDELSDEVVDKAGGKRAKERKKNLMVWPTKAAA
jgi:hypothetical protein